MKNLVINILILVGFVLVGKYADRESLLLTIHRSLPPREAGLLGGILIGDKGGFETEFYEDLKNSGLVHLVVVSGSNVMLLVGGWIEFMARFLGRKKSIAAGLVLGWGYANLVRWEVPVVRAMLMMSIMYWAQLWGRKFNIWRGLFLAAGIMMTGEIMILTSVSFWLSMLAFMAIVTARKLRMKWWWETIWVSWWITPIIGLVWGRISLISPITNVLVMGMVEMITVLGAAGTILGGGVFLWIVYPALRYLAIVVEWGGRIPILNINFNWYLAAGWYLVLFYFLIKKGRQIWE